MVSRINSGNEQSGLSDCKPSDVMTRMNQDVLSVGSADSFDQGSALRATAATTARPPFHFLCHHPDTL